jgi:hypothetical protein
LARHNAIGFLYSLSLQASIHCFEMIVHQHS